MAAALECDGKALPVDETFVWLPWMERVVFEGLTTRDGPEAGDSAGKTRCTFASGACDSDDVSILGAKAADGVGCSVT